MLTAVAVRPRRHRRNRTSVPQREHQKYSRRIESECAQAPRQGRRLPTTVKNWIDDIHRSCRPHRGRYARKHNYIRPGAKDGQI